MGAIYPVGKWEGGEASGNQVNALIGGGGDLVIRVVYLYLY